MMQWTEPFDIEGPAIVAVMPLNAETGAPRLLALAALQLPRPQRDGDGMVSAAGFKVRIVPCLLASPPIGRPVVGLLVDLLLAKEGHQHVPRSIPIPARAAIMLQVEVGRCVRR
jgi:hypothetical protein